MPDVAPPRPLPGGVVRERAIDPRTGLPVLRYRGPRPPTLRPGAPGPVGAWRVLRTVERDGGWLVELETDARAATFADAPQRVDDEAVAAAFATLAAAAAAGLAHGALSAEHVWRTGSEVRIDGYGVGWCDGADPEADARDLARALLALRGTAVSATTRAHLRRLAATEPEARTEAEPDPGAAAAPVHVPATVVRTPPPGATVRPGRPHPASALAAAARRASDLVRPAASFARRAATRVRPVLVFLIARGREPRTWALVAAAAVLVALPGRWRAPSLPATPFATPYALDVQVLPAGSPPARLVVLASPPGSRWAAGAEIASVPRTVALDRAGTWRLEARFADRTTAPVQVDLPSQQRVTLVFPDPAPPAP